MVNPLSLLDPILTIACTHINEVHFLHLEVITHLTFPLISLCFSSCYIMINIALPFWLGFTGTPWFILLVTIFQVTIVCH